MRTVSIVSCARKPSYLAETLRSFEELGVEVEIFYQSKDGAQDIPALRQQYTCAIPRVYLTEKMYDEVQLNGQYNYAETLLNTKDGLFLEDDVRVSKKFMEYLSEVEKLIPDEKSIVTLTLSKNGTTAASLNSSSWRHDTSGIRRLCCIRCLSPAHSDSISLTISVPSHTIMPCVPFAGCMAQEFMP